MKILIHGSETVFHIQQFLPLMEVLDEEEGIEYISFHSNEDLPLHPRSFFMHRLRDFLWDRFGVAKNNFSAKKWYWNWKRIGGTKARLEEADQSWSHPCSALKGFIPWKPDLVIGSTPHEGHMKYQIIPWARKQGVPVLSIDHGAPMIPFHFGGYRGSMMGCNANAVWGARSKQINVGYGAPESGQVITGSPTLDYLSRENGALKSDRKQILLMTTHREPIKSAMDKLVSSVIERYLDSRDFEIVIKPHPIELRNSEPRSYPGGVRVILNQDEYISSIMSAHCIISPSLSVIVPSLALGVPFIDIMQPGSGLADEDELVALSQLFGSVTFTPEQMDDVIEGRISADPKKCREVFEQVGYRSDGKNARRVLDLARHLVAGKQPADWKDPFD